MKILLQPGPQGPPNMPYILIAGALLVGLILGYLIFSGLRKKQDEKLKQTSNDIIANARESARQTELDAKDQALKIIRDAESEIQSRRTELTKEDERLGKRREELDYRFDQMQQRESNLNKRQSRLDKRANEVEALYEERAAELQRVSEMTVDEAREVLLAEVEKVSRADMARIIRQIETEARETGMEKARELIADAIQRVASDKVAEVTTALVTLPNEEMKGRIVGRNGRNIRAFEQVTGVDVIVDDTPEAVTVSCFDSVRREIARRTLTRLVNDGRIHPAYIEKILKKSARRWTKTSLKPAKKPSTRQAFMGSTLRSSKARSSEISHLLRSKPTGTRRGNLQDR